MKNNPFSLDFGAKPGLYIPRFTEQKRVVDIFSAPEPSSHIFFITGVRGSGKTVLMTTVSHTLREDTSWIHIDLNAERDLLTALAASIYKESRSRFPKIKLGVSLKGIELSVEENEKYKDIQIDLDTMIASLKKHHVRVLITVDEISNAKNIREFTSYFQHCLREQLPVFVLMTGLYKNIQALQNNRTQTFLKRAPRIDLMPLNIGRIARKYEGIFRIDPDSARKMSGLTAGYSYGFQILGFLVFESGKKCADEAVLAEYKAFLEESSYDKIWEELSAGERRVVSAIAALERNVPVKTIRNSIGMDSNNFSTYQSSLLKGGILSREAAYGHANFSLPFFREYVRLKTDDEL